MAMWFTGVTPSNEDINAVPDAIADARYTDGEFWVVSATVDGSRRDLWHKIKDEAHATVDEYNAMSNVTGVVLHGPIEFISDTEITCGTQAPPTTLQEQFDELMSLRVDE